MLLIYLSCAWVVGIFLGSRFEFPPVLVLAGLTPLLTLAFERSRLKPVIAAVIGILLLCGGAAYARQSLYSVSEKDLHFYNDQGTVEIRGMVAQAPDVRDSGTSLSFAASEIKLDGEWQEVEGTALVFVPVYPAHQYGDILLIEGELETPPQLGDFDYKGYLEHQGIHATMLYPRVEVLDKGRGFTPLAWIYSFRDRLSMSLGAALPEPQAALARGIILGIRGDIPESLNTAFSRSGTAHLLAISGLHLGIMAGIMLSLGLWLFGRRRYLYVWLALGAVWSYAVITGWHLPVVRGAIMVSLFLFAELLGRQRSAVVALFFAAAVMLGIQPYVLDDASFQMSFLAMVGLIFLFPLLRDVGRRVVAKTIGEDGPAVGAANLLIDSLSATLGAVLAVWPVVAYYFGVVSLVGPLATFLALPALPGIIITGGLAAVLGLVIMPLGLVTGWLAWLFLSYLVVVVNGLASAPLSFIEVDSLDPALIWGYYAALVAGVWALSRRQKLTALPGTSARSGPRLGASFDFSTLKIWSVSLLLPLAVLVSCVAAAVPDGRLHVSFLNVGEGDAILVTQGSRQVLIDGGPAPGETALELGKRMPFWDRSIDLLVLTHPHQDHLSGLIEVLRRYHVEQVLYPDLDYDSPAYEEWRRLIVEKGVKSTAACAGQRITLGDGLVMDVLNPGNIFMQGTASDLDNNSVVISLGAGDIVFLLTGDILQEAEGELIARRAGLDCDVLKVAHHGAGTSTTPGFLAAAGPRFAVISTGVENRYGHPDPEVVERLQARVGTENVYRTDIDGTIEFVTDGRRLWVSIGHE